MCLLSQAGLGLTMWSGCPQTCQSLTTASCAGIVGMSCHAQLLVTVLHYCFVLLRKCRPDLARWFSGQRQSWAGLMTGVQALVSQNGRTENWLSRAVLWTIHSCFGMCAPTLACEYTHIHSINLKCFRQTFLGDVWRPWKANVADLHYSSSERTSYLKSTRLGLGI